MIGEDILDIIDRASKTVVNIEAQDSGQYLFSDKPHERVGSGFVIDDEGRIITNSHLIQGDKSVYVAHGREILRGDVINACRIMDLALVKVEERLPVAELGDSNSVRVGQRVYLIGNPFGIRGSPTVSNGIISGIRRSVRVDHAFLLDLLQTDAHLNPGNSGGPLIDAEGKVIGVATAYIPTAQGIGFSIPINTVKEYVGQVKARGSYVIPWIGLDGVTITPNMNHYYDLGTDYGVLVTGVVRDSPADRAGISPRRTDLVSGLGRWLGLIGLDQNPLRASYSIVSFNGLRVEGFEELLRMIRGSEIGSTVKLEVLRQGRRRQIGVEIGETS